MTLLNSTDYTLFNERINVNKSLKKIWQRLYFILGCYMPGDTVNKKYEKL
jgi:hypothetical protein